MNSLIIAKWKKQGNSPLYQQIAEFLVRCIENGDLPPRYTFPGHRKLAECFGVSINTILHSLHILQSNNYIKVPPRSKPVVNQKLTDKPDWDKYISTSLYNPAHTNFFSFAENHVGSLNLAMGLDKDYYFREVYNDVMPNIKIPDVMITSPFGLPLLREEICTHIKKHNIIASQEQVMIVTSVFHAMNVLFLGLLGHGTNLLVPKPCNLSISNLIRTTGANLIGLPMDENGIIISKLQQAVQSSHHCILCISPDLNIPTGIITSLERRQQILATCIKYKIPIIEHTFFPLGSTLTDLPSIKSMDNTGLTIHLSQIGTTGSTNPWLGWLIGDEYLLKRLNNIRFNLDAHQNYLMQIATLEIFQTGKYDNFLERICSIRKKRFHDITELLNKHLKPLAMWNKTNMDAALWLEFDKRINTFHMYKEADRIAFHPGKFYDESDHRHAFVYPIALNLANLELGLKELARLARNQL